MNIIKIISNSDADALLVGLIIENMSFQKEFKQN